MQERCLCRSLSWLTPSEWRSRCRFLAVADVRKAVPTGTGSGWVRALGLWHQPCEVYDEEGHIITNYHVIESRA